jgi:Ca-activated chloride channel family protein
MAGFIFLHPQWLLGLAVVAFGAVIARRLWRDRFFQAPRGYADNELKTWLEPARLLWVSRFKYWAWIFATACCFLALARPQMRVYQAQALAAGPPVMLVLDCSSSMLVQDAEPSRFELAQSSFLELLPALTRHPVGVIAFAGEPFLVCPLTYDHLAVAAALAGLRPQSLAPGGTAMVRAVQLAAERLRTGAHPGAMILLMSDGEENQSQANSALAQGLPKHIRIDALGVGSREGGPIPIGRDFWGRQVYREYRGERVISRKADQNLRRLALGAGGRYADASNRRQAAGFFLRGIRQAAEQSASARRLVRVVEWYQWPLSMALLAGWAAWLLPAFGRRAWGRE